MTIGVLSSTLFGDMFGTAAMRAAFGELGLLSRCAEVEAALARAQARVGIVPAAAAAAISQAAAAIIEQPASLDLARLKRETETVGYPILPLVRQLADRAGDAGRWVHWGATTQDIMDTAVVLQIRAGLELIEADLTGLRGHLAALARRWRDTPMAGRTHLQHALPITFGYKAAVWLAAFDRHAARLAELKPRVPAGAASSGNQTPADQTEREQAGNPTSPAIRQFQRGQVMQYGFIIYNAHLDKATGQPQLLVQTKVFRSGQPVFTGKEQPFVLNNPPDLKRLSVNGGIQLGTDMTPNEYILQIVVTDLLADQKHRLAAQWIDFEVVK